MLTPATARMALTTDLRSGSGMPMVISYKAATLGQLRHQSRMVGGSQITVSVDENRRTHDQSSRLSSQRTMRWAA